MRAVRFRAKAARFRAEHVHTANPGRTRKVDRDRFDQLERLEKDTHRTATTGDLAFALPDPRHHRLNRIHDSHQMQTPTKWKHNFSAGPSAVDAGVLAKLSAELASFEDTGMVSVDVA